MTVLGYLTGQWDKRRPIYTMTPAGLRRVIQVDTSGDVPKLTYLTEDGATSWKWALLSTELVQEQDCLVCGHVHQRCCVCDDLLPCNDDGYNCDFICDACVYFLPADDIPASWLIVGRNHCEGQA